MAVPSYTEDLTDIDLAESGSTGWTAFNISGGGGGAPAFGADLGMQGAGAWDKPCSNAERGLAVNKTPGTGTVAAGVHIYVWGFCGTPGITDSLLNRGVYVIIGTSTNNFMQFHVEGKETFGATGRVGKCYVVDYITTPNTGSVPYSTENGTAGATPTYFGYGLKTTQSAKGSNIGCDAIRYGTGAFLTAGELIAEGDASDDPCTFDGYSTQNDLVANRWGIFTLVSGSYELQGNFSIGQNNAGTATKCTFEDFDRTIVIVDTVHSETTFSRFIIDHVDTVCNWNNINISALGTNNRGYIEVLTTATFAAVGGVWTGINNTILNANSSIDGTTFRETTEITLGSGATITNANIINNRAAVSIIGNATNNIEDVTNTLFESDGSNHAFSTHSSVTTGSFDWDGNTLTGYVAGTAASPVTATSTGNEAIYVLATTGEVTFNVTNGATIPSIRSAGAVVNVAVAYTLTLTGIPTGTQVTIVNSSTRTELQNTSSSSGDVTYIHGGGETVDILLMSVDIDPDAMSTYDLLLPSENSSVPYKDVQDRNYDNPPEPGASFTI